MAQNPLFRVDNSPTRTTRPTKAVNEVRPRVPLTHNTFDNSFFNFKTQRYGLYEPFWWKVCVAGDKEPFSSSHNVRSLPFASPIESPMHLNKDYFQVPMYAIQPNTWDYIFKSPSQGDDVPFRAQNLFPLVLNGNGFPQEKWTIADILNRHLFFVHELSNPDSDFTNDNAIFQSLMLCELFFSSGSLLFQMGYKMNPRLKFFDSQSDSWVSISFDDYFNRIINTFYNISFTLNLPSKTLKFATSSEGLRDVSEFIIVDKWTILSLYRSFAGYVSDMLTVSDDSYDEGTWLSDIVLDPNSFHFSADDDKDRLDIDGVDCIRMDVINAYQLSCSQYYVNPRVDFIYTAQLYRDNWISSLRSLFNNYTLDGDLNLDTFDYNGIPVLYDYFSLNYYYTFVSLMNNILLQDIYSEFLMDDLYSLTHYLFGHREQLKFGDYFNDSRTQPLGYGEEGSDRVDVMDDSVNVIDLSSKLVLTRYRSAVAKLDNTAEDYLATMFKEQLPPDYHYPKFIVHSEFAIDGSEVSNTTSDDQGNIVTNLKSGADTAEFDITISVPSILIGISYIHIPRVYDSIKERAYMHEDRYDMFIPMLQYFGDQQIYNRELSDSTPDPSGAYGYVSRNGEFKQRVSQASGGFTGALRSWIFVDHPSTSFFSEPPRLSNNQSPVAIRAYDWEFNRFLKQQSGYSLGSGFHFIMKYNNKNVDERPMEVNPLTLYPSAI